MSNRRRPALIAIAIMSVAALLLGTLVAVQVRSERKEKELAAVADANELKVAIDRAAPGAVIKLAAASFGDLQLSQWTREVPVTIEGPANGAALFGAVTLVDVDGLIFKNLTFNAPFEARSSTHLRLSDSRFTSGVRFRDGVTDVLIERNRIEGGSIGIWVWNSAKSERNKRVTIAGNDISRQTGDNIQIGAVDDLLIEDNLIHDIADNEDHNDGIQVMGSEGAVIRRNRLWNQDQAILLKAEPYLGPGNRVANARLENNLVHNERGAGFIIAGTADAELINNTSYDNRHADIHIDGFNTNLSIVNNVVRQIFTTGKTAPIQDHNCVEHGKRGANDVQHKPRFQPGNDYKLEPGDECSTAATRVEAPPDDITGKARKGQIITGAWQTES